MTYNFIKELEQKFSVIQKENQIEVYLTGDNGYPFLDTGFKLANKNNIWSLYLIQRENNYYLNDFENEKKAELALYAACEGKLQKVKKDNHIINYLKDSNNNYEAKVDFLKENLNNMYLSFNQDKKGTVTLGVEDDFFSVSYLNMLGEKKYITKRRPIQGALITMYNFATKLEQFDLKFNAIIQQMELKVCEIELLKSLYIGR